MRFALCNYFTLFRNILHKLIVYSTSLTSLFLPPGFCRYYQFIFISPPEMVFFYCLSMQD